MRKFNTLTFNEDSWLIQETPTNPLNLSIYKNGISTGYFLKTVKLRPLHEKSVRVCGYTLYDTSKEKTDLIKELFNPEIDFNLMVDVVNTINGYENKTYFKPELKEVLYKKSIVEDYLLPDDINI